MIYDEDFNKIGIKIPNILLPQKNVDLSKFSVIAADQFSTEHKYWDKVAAYVGDSVSTYNLFLPEAKMPLTKKKLKEISTNMKNYINEKKLEEIGEGFIYVERMTTSGVRHGLIVAVDLEKYDYNKNSKTLIRPTEGTVKDRLPIRVEIRKVASIDLSHVIMLIDDKKNLLFNYLCQISKEKNTIYDFDLMFGGGNIKGYKIDKEEEIYNILNILNSIKENCIDNLMYAIGDGNHSLAAAKICYEENKTEKNRYALVELENIYDEAVEFFPINRLLINVDKEKFKKELEIDVNNPPPLQDLQIMIDKFLKNNKSARLEYIHGSEECKKLGSIDGNIPIIYEKFEKNNFFNDIIKHGSLCRKSFSIGKNIDKRYYLESIKIK